MEEGGCERNKKTEGRKRGSVSRMKCVEKERGRGRKGGKMRYGGKRVRIRAREKAKERIEKGRRAREEVKKKGMPRKVIRKRMKRFREKKG